MANSNRRRLTTALDLLGVFLAGMGMSVLLIPMAAHGATAAGIVKVVFTALSALWLGSDVVRRVNREQY